MVETCASSVGFFSVKRTALLLLVSLLTACASLPEETRQTGVHDQSPVLANSVQLSEALADSLIQATGDAHSNQARNSLDKLADAVRSETDSPFIFGNLVTPLIDGPETFTRIRQCIEAARSSVHVETYIFADDEFGRSFAQLLIKKAQQGVEVRVIFDALGSIASATTLFDTMRDAGVQVEEFHPLAPLRTLPWRYNNRDHRKIVVVDGLTVFTGGINISGAYSSGSLLKPGPDEGLKPRFPISPHFLMEANRTSA